MGDRGDDVRMGHPAPYEFPIGHCDVQDRKALARYRGKRIKWLAWLEGDPDNSIVSQLHGMMWSDATFRALNKARGYASQQSPTGAVAPLLAEFLDQGFVATQVLAITRLIDKGSEVVSLWRLLDDIAENPNLITREIFVCFDGLPYDARAAETAYWAKHGRPKTSASVGLPTSGP